MVNRKPTEINLKIRELELAVAKLKANRNYLLKELESVKTRTNTLSANR